MEQYKRCFNCGHFRACRKRYPHISPGSGYCPEYISQTTVREETDIIFLLPRDHGKTKKWEMQQ